MLEALKHAGYQRPTPIQAGLIPLAMQGIDVVGQARTGTGTTAAFAIPILANLESRRKVRGPQALVLTPTRELAVQVRDETGKLAHGRPGACVAVHGGKPLRGQIHTLRRGAQHGGRTPGRGMARLASGPTQCWSVSSPKETVNTRGGRVVAVRRGDILLFVSYIPSSNVSGQISFAGGYPFRKDSTVTLKVGDTKFELFTKGEMAWSASNEDDAKIIAALKRGSEAVLSGVSSRGPRTQDTFSLFGFTAAVDEAAKRCAG